MSGTGSSPTVNYTPIADYNGEDSFSLKVSDTSGNTDSIIVNVTVFPVNDSPIITLPEQQTVFFDSTLEFSTSNGNPIVLADIDAGAESIVLLPSKRWMAP